MDYRSGLSFSLLAIFLFVIVCDVFYPWNLQITSGYGSDAEITALVDQYDWKFIPIANPDGYAYTWSNVNRTGSISWPICIIIRRAIQNVINLFLKFLYQRIDCGGKIVFLTMGQHVLVSMSTATSQSVLVAPVGALTWHALLVKQNTYILILISFLYVLFINIVSTISL